MDIETKDIAISAATQQTTAKLFATGLTLTKPLFFDIGYSQRPLQKLPGAGSPNGSARGEILVATIAKEKLRRGAEPRHSNMGAFFPGVVFRPSRDLLPIWDRARQRFNESRRARSS
jgi:hypothetical protein